MWFLCAIVVLMLRTSKAVVPQQTIATNAVTGELQTNFSFEMSGTNMNTRGAEKPGMKAHLQSVSRELQDTVLYGLPYLADQEPMRLLLPLGGVLLLIWLSFKLFRST